MKKQLIVILLTACLFSCGEIFETNIGNKTVEVISPRDGVTAPQGKTTFLWKKIESATHYHITIVSPDFATASRVVADTIIPDSIPAFSQILPPGDYQWSIRACNFAYRTKENILTLHVVAVDDVGEEEEDDE